MADDESTFFHRYVKEISKLRRFIEFCWFGLDRATRDADFQKWMFGLLAENGYAQAGQFQALLPPEEVEGFASAEREAEFQFLYGLAVVRLWSILETVVDTAASFIIRTRKPAELPEALKSIRAPIFEYLSADADAQAEYLLAYIKQDTKCSLKPGVGRFEALLSAVGFGGSVASEVSRDLLELSEIRHLVVHRGGIVDAKFVDRCPWLGKTKGSDLRISKNDFSRYALSADWYIYEILDRTLDEFDADDPYDAKKMAAHHGTLASHKSRLLKDRNRRAPTTEEVKNSADPAD